MTQADDIMVRETPPGWHNLAIGEPVFLQDALNGFFSGVTEVGSAQKTYPPTGGLRSLRLRLAEHLLLKPEDADRIVVANGARQALIAAMVAARTWNPDLRADLDAAWAPKPYWPGFPTLAKHAGLEWLRNPEVSWPFVEIVAWPNNPSGLDPAILWVAGPKVSHAFRIHDAVYAHAVYGYSPGGQQSFYDADVTIGSASKEFGLSGLRVGWAVFKDRNLADIAASYIETTTSGVSLPAQSYMEDVLERVAWGGDRYPQRLANAQKTIAKNRRIFRDVVHRVAGCTLQGTGMFDWFGPEDPADFAAVLEESKVLMVDGKHCGMPGFFRANVGVSAFDMEKAVFALEEAV